MNVNIVERAETIIQHNIAGVILANQLEEKFKKQGSFRGRREDTNNIILQHEYFFTVTPDEESEE